MLFLQLRSRTIWTYRIYVLNLNELIIKERENFDRAKSTDLPDYTESLKF